MMICRSSLAKFCIREWIWLLNANSKLPREKIRSASIKVSCTWKLRFISIRISRYGSGLLKKKKILSGEVLSDSYDADSKAIHFNWLGPELFPLLLGPPGLNWWSSFVSIWNFSYVPLWFCEQDLGFDCSISWLTFYLCHFSLAPLKYSDSGS